MDFFVPLAAHNNFPHLTPVPEISILFPVANEELSEVPSSA